jgi:hypothetical protein
VSEQEEKGCRASVDGVREYVGRRGKDMQEEGMRK